MKKILIIDDHLSDDESSITQDDRDALQMIVFNLEQFAQVLKASTSEEGIAIAEREKPQVILLDVMLNQNDKDGFDVCREIKTNRKIRDCVVLLLTRRDTSGDDDLAEEVEADGLLKKTSPQPVIEAVRHHLLMKG